MITIENGRVLYGENFEVMNANVLIQDQEILEVSQNVKEGKIIDARGCIVAPALINSHVHLGDSMALDRGDGKPIEELVKPPNGIKHRIIADTPAHIMVESMKRSMQEMLQTGTTTLVDFREGGFEGINLLNEASEGLPIRKIVLGRDDSFLNSCADPSKIVKIVESLLESCDGIAPSGLGEISDSLATIIAKTSKMKGKLSAIHAAEYEKVQKDSLDTTGKTEVQRAIEAGFDLLVHLTAPMKDDLKMVAKSGIPVVSCPRSNGALAAGIPPLKEMFDAGINLLLGTDNLMFNSPNLLREMEYALKVTRGFYKEYFPPREIFKMATINAAQALNLNLGLVEEGKIADIMIVKQLSHDPMLSIINRTESKDIKGLLTQGKIVRL